MALRLLRRAGWLAAQVAVLAFFVAPWFIVIFFSGTSRDPWPAQLFFVLLGLNGAALWIDKHFGHKIKNAVTRRHVAA